MTLAQIDLVKQSWRQTATATPPLSEVFYARLFTLEPGLRALFCNDMRLQQKKLSDMLGIIIKHLDKPADLTSTIRALGIRHSGYGVKDEHYTLVEQALIQALQDCLGQAFNPATEQAWRLAYRALADAMSTADIDNLMYPG
ncbi:MAG: globin domain-containing protein [Gammaproteobacteria bacterium]